MTLTRRKALDNLTKDELVSLARKNSIYVPKSTTKTGMISHIMSGLPKDAIMSEIVITQSSPRKRRVSSGVRTKRHITPGRPRRCAEQHTKKYVTRPSPPYPANQCCGQYKTGNDGLRYKSVPNYKGVCRWVKIKY